MIPRYNTTAIALHWLIALLFFATFPLGLYMADLNLSPTKLRLYSWHKWIGVSIFFLVLLRILWRASHKPPPPVAMPQWQRMAAESVHYVMYACMVVIPISGWLMSSAMGFTTVWFGVLPLPDLVERNKDLAGRLQNVHEWLNYGLLALVAGHVGAALEHQFVKKNGLIGRLNPFARSGKLS